MKATNMQNKHYKRQLMEMRKTKQENYGLWCDTLYKLSIANHFKDQVIYYPHNIDFRGRVYPIAPHFQHMGGDLTRSLLIFGKGLPLGKEGFSWLKLHCINLTEFKKKASIQERMDYAEQVITNNALNKPLSIMHYAQQVSINNAVMICGFYYNQ